jgi:hypothetical protein
VLRCSPSLYFLQRTDALCDGAVVGRIFKANAAPVGSPWMDGRPKQESEVSVGSTRYVVEVPPVGQLRL